MSVTRESTQPREYLDALVGWKGEFAFISMFETLMLKEGAEVGEVAEMLIQSPAPRTVKMEELACLLFEET